ncbi:hypothetical protein SSABA_v1c03880 [Spiroplasma sabaudiense Ar-1343]|uniref:Uncharacterized protein n=1 Tax=Spiroplasma sabaudiense Ar-1343 TaxID=1276257 RepID=W6A9U1_9MOLU|nr:hypothetical protein [Spiroplasma sabaudiense]AHI53797.1 hypothetical protein SSABA_v1c03880 [Spiroplasma sabaudiense Ar-1343]
MKKLLSTLGAMSLIVSGAAPVMAMTSNVEFARNIIQVSQFVDTSRYAVPGNWHQLIPGTYDETESFVNFVNDVKSQMKATGCDEAYILSGYIKFRVGAHQAKIKDLDKLEKLLNSDNYEIKKAYTVISNDPPKARYEFNYFADVVVDGEELTIDLSGYQGQKLDGMAISSNFTSSYSIELKDSSKKVTFKLQTELDATSHSTKFDEMVDWLNEVSEFIKDNKIEKDQFKTPKWAVSYPDTNDHWIVEDEGYSNWYWFQDQSNAGEYTNAYFTYESYDGVWSIKLQTKRGSTYSSSGFKYFTDTMPVGKIKTDFEVEIYKN